MEDATKINSETGYVKVIELLNAAVDLLVEKNKILIKEKNDLTVELRAKEAEIYVLKNGLPKQKRSWF